MRPFVSYFGGKWRLARNYGPPQRDHVVEPFAGFAGYSVYWEPRQVTLYEVNPKVIGVWRYLQRASPRDLMALPTEIDSLDELPSSLGQEARDLVGWWLNMGLSQPAQRRSNKGRSFGWRQQIRRRLASQVGRIRHWSIIEGSYEDAPDIEAHWHVDPPYAKSGSTYRFNVIDRVALADWCLSRQGFTHVCEGGGADWLPFQPFRIVYGHRGGAAGGTYSSEALFELER